MTTKQFKTLLGVVFGINFLTAIYNIGIIALDDYTNGISVMVPAQLHMPVSDLFRMTIHPPIARVFLTLVAKIPLAFGIYDPILQLRISLGLLCVLNFWLIYKAIQFHFEEEKLKRLATLLAFSFFLMPLFNTRPMIETLSLPWLTLSSGLACAYWRKPKTSLALGALVSLVVASLFRFQCGVCVFALIPILYLRATRKDFILYMAAGAGLFVLSGIPDWYYRGAFHSALRDYIYYNVLYGGSNHGRMPFYNFILLWLGVSIPPTFFSKFKGFDWKKTYKPLLPAVLYFFVFLITHSINPHKEERFMVPMLVVFIILLTPLVVYFWKHQEHRWRLYYAGTINFLALIVCCTSIPQINVISVAQFANAHPHWASISILDKSTPYFPGAYVNRPIHLIYEDSHVAKASPKCDRLYLMSEGKWNVNEESSNIWTQVAKFSPAWPEALMAELNPKHNARRGALLGLTPKFCPPGL